MTLKNHPHPTRNPGLLSKPYLIAHCRSSDSVQLWPSPARKSHLASAVMKGRLISVVVVELSSHLAFSLACSGQRSRGSKVKTHQQGPTSRQREPSIVKNDKSGCPTYQYNSVPSPLIEPLLSIYLSIPLR